MRTVVAKFGGTSLADAGQFRKIRQIVKADPDRRFLVASAPGKRFADDIKVTDLLLACFEKADAGLPFDGELARIRDRYQSILQELGLDFPLDAEIAGLSEHLASAPDREFTASRGEYLCARILAQYLGFTFVDPAWCICFDANGDLDMGMTKRALGASLKPLKNAVIAKLVKA